jgi:membrane-bound lytic murein transglycosylase D
MVIKTLIGQLSLAFFLLFFSCALFSQNNISVNTVEESLDSLDLLTEKGDVAPFVLSDADFMEKMSTLSSCVDVRMTDVVKGYIRTYTQFKSDKSRIMLGKRLTYFPLFEEKFKEYGIPQDLKYLSVVESALNPKAVSRVGATGLWQFMPSTGSEYGLRANSAVEDRSNPVKSTDAAARHLRDLYKQFNDWALVLAAYNSGAGRVNAAIKRSGSKNFWELQRFLPLETRNYVPAFIAATYICNYFQVYGLTPYDPDMDQQLTTYINVYEGISFRDIADVTGVSYEVVKDLNPGFKRDYVPPTNEGHYVVVPLRVMPAFVRYLNTVSNARHYVLENPENYTSPDIGDGRYWQSTVNLKENVSVEDFASRLGMCGEHIKSWNNINTNYLCPGQSIKLIRPVFVQKHTAIRIDAPNASVPKVQSTGLTPIKNEPISGSKTGTKKQTLAPVQTETPRIIQYQYHTVKRNESLEDIARQYSTSVESLRKHNNCAAVKFGMRLKIREF